MKTTTAIFGKIVSGGSLTFIWLVIFGILASELGGAIGIFAGILAILAFLYFHVWLKKPAGWGHERLKFLFPRYLIVIALASVVLMLGDIFWLYQIKSSSDPFPEDTIVFLFLGVVAFPLIEEFGFRLWIQTRLEEHMNSLIAVFLVAGGFALMHQPEMPIPQFLSGVLYGVTLIVTKSIWVPVGLHAFHNGLLMFSGQLEIVRQFSFSMMDRPGYSNLYIAITLWITGAALIFLWYRLSVTREPNDDHL